MRSSRPFARANRKENSTLPKQKTSSNCDIPAGETQSTNHSRRVFQNREKQKSSWRASFFSKKSQLFFEVFLWDGGRRQIFGFWSGLLAGGFFGFGDFGGSKSHLRRLSLGFADGKRLRPRLLSLGEDCWDLSRPFRRNALGFEFLNGSSLDSFD